MNVPVALNCWEAPAAEAGFLGVTSMETRVAAVTVSEVDPDTLPEAAVTFVVPVESERANPFETTSLLMDATASFDRLHVTDAVMSRVVLSENTPVALNCWVVPSAILGSAGLTSRDRSAEGGLSPPPQPQPVRKVESNSAIKSKAVVFFISSPFPFIFVVSKMTETQQKNAAVG